MTVTKGREGSITLATNVVGEVRNFKLTENAGAIEANTMGSDWEKSATGLKSWEVDLGAFFDRVDVGQAGVAVGDEVAVELHPEGDTTGNAEYTGTARVESLETDQAHDTLVEITMKLRGIGALTKGTAA